MSDERTPRPDTPQDDAYWQLRGLMGQWMDAYQVPRDRALLYLARMHADLRSAEDCHVLARLQALEAAVEEEPA
jgi:hypothetical protein